MPNPNNQFFDLMKSFMNPEFYTNSMKNMPAADFSAMSDTIKKSSKIFATTNQIAAESLQSMIQKNSEDFQNNVTNMMNAVKEAMTSGDLKKFNDCQQKYLKSTYEASINNAKEFADMASGAAAKIIEAFNSATEQMAKSSENIVKSKS